MKKVIFPSRSIKHKSIWENNISQQQRISIEEHLCPQFYIYTFYIHYTAHMHCSRTVHCTVHIWKPDIKPMLSTVSTTDSVLLQNQSTKQLMRITVTYLMRAWNIDRGWNFPCLVEAVSSTLNIWTSQFWNLKFHSDRPTLKPTVTRRSTTTNGDLVLKLR